MRGTFLESLKRYDATYDFCFIGIEYCSADYLKGVENAADEIRALSYRYANADSTARPLKVYNPDDGFILSDTDIVDFGNVEASNMEMLRDKLTKISFPFYAVPIFVGGDHSVSFELIRKICSSKIYRDIVVVQFDAHSDYIDEYEEYPHGSVMNEVSKLSGVSKIIHFGLRGNLNSGPAIAHSKRKGNFVVPYSKIGQEYDNILKELKGKNVYITFDTDFLNPIYAPATNCPEPGGATYEDTLKYLKDFINVSEFVVGMDFVEYNPSCEGSVITGTTILNIIMQSLHYLTVKNNTKL